MRPWILTNERNYWFTKAKTEDTLYVAVKEPKRWPYGEWKEIVLKSVRATAETTASVLGQNDQVLEYQPKVVPQTTFEQQSDGLHIRAMRAQRLYDDRKWPNPVVLKLTHVKPALTPPVVETVGAKWNGNLLELEANLIGMGDSASLEAGFEYRPVTGQDVYERTGEWTTVPAGRRTAPGRFMATVRGPLAGYEFRAVVRHPRLNVYGADKPIPRQ